MNTEHRYIIIGGGVAGITAAKTIRQQDANGEIIVYTNEFHPLGHFARKDIARSLGQRNAEANDFLIETPEQLAQQGIKLLYRGEGVNRVFAHQNVVQVAHNIRRAYNRLLIATGAFPKIADGPGAHYIGVHQLRNAEDLTLLQAWLPELQQRGAVIIGGGILGLDTAYALRQRGVRVTLVAREAHVGAPVLSAEAARVVETHFEAAGVEVILNDTLAAYLSEDERVLDGVQLASGRTIATRMALSAIGVYPHTDLLEDSGIEVDEATRAVPVNAYLQTNMPNVYAAGNVAVFNGHISRNWKDSEEQGRVAGLNMVGQRTIYVPQQGDLETHIAGLPFAYFGQINATPNDQVLRLNEGNNQFAQVLVNHNRITGFTLLGDAVSAAPYLADLANSQTPVKLTELEGVFSGRQQPTL